MDDSPRKTPAVSPDDGRALARFARDRIREELGGPPAAVPESPGCLRLGASFVTLHWPDGRLQGCVGSLVARQPLVEDVAANAVAAALRDPRVETLALEDVDALAVELSVLSPLARLVAYDEPAARAALRPGVDGVVLRCRGRRATFLPQMWTRFPDPGAFLGELKRKAGFRRDFWSADLEVWRYTVETFDDRAAP